MAQCCPVEAVFRHQFPEPELTLREVKFVRSQFGSLEQAATRRDVATILSSVFVHLWGDDLVEGLGEVVERVGDTVENGALSAAETLAPIIAKHFGIPLPGAEWAPPAPSRSARRQPSPRPAAQEPAPTSAAASPGPTPPVSAPSVTPSPRAAKAASHAAKASRRRSRR